MADESTPDRQADDAMTSDHSTPGTSTPGNSTPGTSTPGTSRPGTSRPGTSRPGTSTPGTPGTVDPRWARRQTPLAVIGALLSLAALAAAIAGSVMLPLSAVDAEPFAVAAVAGAAVLAVSCLVVLACWLIQVRRWRAAPNPLPTGRAGMSGLSLVSLVAHLVSYLAVLVTMYGAIAGSARAYWDSLAATLLGITFLLAIFARILGGTQVLRNGGPPATIPYYLRRLNAKVQSLR
jgi:hypothetical protein